MPRPGAMMKQIPVSVVVVSRGRPDRLQLCLTGLSRLHYSTYEIIVVADPQGLAAARDLPFADHLRLIPFDLPNISAARNIGISASAGEVVAFIDDDAVPEPNWLHHLGGAFADPEVAAAGGFVIGRNGISWQWKARWVNDGGEATPLEINETAPTVLHPRDGRAIKTEGTNMAVRRWVLKKLGGFDEGFRFFLDETDLNMRLAAHGFATAIVPLAVVHHGYASSSRRMENRAVLDLSDIGRSSALFWRKHAPEGDWPTYENRLRQAQRRRVMAQMRDGLLEPGAARRALASLQRGLDEGKAARFLPAAQIARRQNAFVAFPTAVSGPEVVLTGGFLHRARLLRQATDLARKGRPVSLFILSKTAVFHTVNYTKDGVWLQQGGQFGKSLRSDRLFQLFRKEKRTAREWERVRPYRERPNE